MLQQSSCQYGCEIIVRLRVSECGVCDCGLWHHRQPVCLHADASENDFMLVARHGADCSADSMHSHQGGACSVVAGRVPCSPGAAAALQSCLFGRRLGDAALLDLVRGTWKFVFETLGSSGGQAVSPLLSR